jgi:two-component system, NarL family, response regulator NreC
VSTNRKDVIRRGAHDVDGRESAIGVVIVDSALTRRESLELLLRTQRDLEVLGGVSTATEAADLISGGNHPPCSIALLALPLRGNEDFLGAIESLGSSPSTVVRLTYGLGVDRMSVGLALLAGADGFVDTALPPGEFLEAIRRAARGELVLAGLGSSSEESVPRSGIEGIGYAPLSPREREVLTLAADGYTARQIATRLGVRERTVTTHLSRIYRKLGTSGRMESVRAAIRTGIIDIREGIDHPA